MSGLLKTMLMIPSGGAAKIELEVNKIATIFSTYSVTVLAFEEITAQLSAVYLAGVLEIEEVVTASISSVYSLAVA